MTATPVHLPRQDSLKGGLYMAIAMAAFVSNDTFMKLLSHELPVGTLIFVRGVFASLVLLVATAFSGALPKLPQIISGNIVIRSLADVVSTILFISALVHMPIGNLTAVVQAAPLAVTALAAIVLKERVGWRRTLAMAAGFIGVMVIVRPSTSSFDRYSVMALLVVAGVALRDILTRRIPVTVPAFIVALANSVFVSLGAFGLALLEGGLVMPNGYQLLYLAAAGGFLSLGYLFMVQTLRYADISVSATIRFSVVLWALLSGVTIFGEWPDRYAIIGILLVVGAGVYTLHREAKLKKQRNAQAAK